ncbi:hypothetical protein BCR34DRAFT_103618 [Clohesyomyces aquaticus]|uniref:Uncharacterized protein n=1 Tax=Clohesyomyces aquaticus TaxID=1231657 RepID=A0A1Y2A2Z8_9PLEO|nr:hypothetical protein BCR34DRAFT_103618 [Clohesyomyces aquaticus]
MVVSALSVFGGSFFQYVVSIIVLPCFHSSIPYIQNIPHLCNACETRPFGSSPRTPTSPFLTFPPPRLECSWKDSGDAHGRCRADETRCTPRFGPAPTPSSLLPSTHYRRTHAPAPPTHPCRVSAGSPLASDQRVQHPLISADEGLMALWKDGCRGGVE